MSAYATLIFAAGCEAKECYFGARPHIPRGHKMVIYEDVFRRFKKEKVDYIIVGGIAANLLGLVRATADLDILIDVSRANFTKVDTILRGLGYKIKQPINIKKIGREYIDKLIKTKNLKAINYYKPGQLSEVDIIADSPVSFEAAKKKVKIYAVNNLKLPVVSIDGLIKMKAKTGRAVDKYDVAELRKVKRMISK